MSREWGRGRPMWCAVPLVLAVAACAPGPTPRAASSGRVALPPDIEFPNEPRAAWRASRSLLTVDGGLVPEAAERYRDATAAMRRGDQCFEQTVRKEDWTADNSWPPDLADFVSRATAILIGRVVALEPGFSSHWEAGVMLEVAVEERLKPSEVYPFDSLFVFLPGGEIRLGTLRICQSQRWMPAWPSVGDRLLLAPRRPPSHDRWPIVTLLNTAPEIVVLRADGTVDASRALENVAELASPIDLAVLSERMREQAHAPRAASEVQ